MVLVYVSDTNDGEVVAVVPCLEIYGDLCLFVASLMTLSVARII